MRTKLLISLVILIIAISYFLKNTDVSYITENTTAQSIPVTNKNNIDKPSIQAKLKQIKANKETDNNPQKQPIIKTINSIYDDDPVVDANLIIRNNRLCFRQLSTNKYSNRYINRFKQGLDKKQQQYYQNFINHCEKLNKEHPEYSLSNIKKILNQRTTAIATSYWGEIINGKIDASKLSNDEVQNLLKQNNLSIITDAPRYLQKYYQEVIHWDIENVLQNHQYDYIDHILTYAHQLYLCGIGADCSPNSSIMAMFCYLNSQSCGLDYPDYIDNILTHGQQADVQLAMIYLQSKYQ